MQSQFRISRLSILFTTSYNISCLFIPYGIDFANTIFVITAIPYWKERVAPVFDTARQFVIIKSEHGKITEEERITLEESNSIKVSQLKNKAVDSLICGAVSQPVEIMVLSYGIKVIAFISGNLHDVIQAWIDGDINKTIYIMPGCYMHRKHQHGFRTHRCKEVQDMRGSNGSGGGQGTGRGKGRNQGPLGAGTGGNCVCPKCGYSENHERGVPCTQKQCPKCGATLIRQ